MLKKLLKAIFKEAVGKKHHYSSDAWKKGYKHSSHSHYGHRHYKKKHRSHSVFSSFFSS
ncbi:hypothetical protein [Neobacillus sp. LXY-4]|uniref:hypothetical protein n=1 Tax=Neobacillus sp. LXY-4 TaxID=3379826 RepID=UPI003EDFA8B3